ncbi:MAG: hypothetical protein Q4G33_02400 [bacterium]|nr:hypothetical protein [bacterium]
MKKLLFTTAAASVMLFSAASVSAAVGDIAGTIYTTDILTQIDGRAIPSYSIDGETLIALEDLEPYGFTLYYNDNIRTVFLTKTGEPSSSFYPYVSRGTVGETAGYYYDTDITAVVNGQSVTAYAINGKMVAKVEELGQTGSLSNFGRYPYLMSFNYDNSKRLLSLNTSQRQFGSSADAQKVILDYRLWQPNYNRIIHSNNKMLTARQYGGLSHGGTAYEYYVTLDNGLIYNAYSIARRYDICMSDPVFSENGNYLYFKNTDISGNFRDYKQLELNSMHVMPLDASAYNQAAARFVRSDYTFTLDGKTLTLYSIGSADYIKASDLRKNGYSVNNVSTDIFNSEEYIPLSEYEYYFGNDTNSGIKYSYDPYKKHITAFSVK